MADGAAILKSRRPLSGKVWKMTGTAEAAREHRSVEEISESIENE